MQTISPPQLSIPLRRLLYCVSLIGFTGAAVLGTSASPSQAQVPSLADYSVLRWAGTPDLTVKARMGKGAKVVDGHVCVDLLAMRRQTIIGSGLGANSDAVALRTSKAAMRFAKPVTVAQDVITGGGLIRGEQNVTYGGRIDKTGTAPEVTDCRDAADEAMDKHAEFTNPAIVGTAVGTINGGGQQTISATDPGCNIIDINEIRLRKDAKLNIIGGPLTRSVIIRVATKMHMGRRVEIVLQGGLTPEQVLFIVEGPFTSRRDIQIRGTVMGNHPIWIGRGGMVEGQLLSSRKVVMRRFSMITHKSFIDWFGTCGQPTPTPTRTTALPTNTPAPTGTPTDTPTAAPTATETATAAATDTGTPEPPATDTPLPPATDTPSPTDTATTAASDTPTPTETATGTTTATATSTPSATQRPERPDLIESSISNPPASILDGDSFSVTDTAFNQGNRRALASKTRYYLSVDAFKSNDDTLLVGVRDVPVIPLGNSSTGTRTVQATGVAPGTYFLLACADDTQLLVEHDETNNCRASTSTVTVGP